MRGPAAKKVKTIHVPATNKVSRSGPGRSGGFLKTRKVRKTKKAAINRRGIDFTMETGGATESNECVYIGHSVAPFVQLRKMAATALIKELMLRAGANVNRMESPLEVQATDKIIVRFNYHPSSILVLDTFNFAAAGTVSDAVAWFENPARGWNIQDADSDNRTFYSIQFLPSDNLNYKLRPTTLHMARSRVHYVAKSALKIQNRTVSTLGDEADDVDNVPLYGKSYEGNGTGTVHIRMPRTDISPPSFYANKETSVILEEFNNAENGAPREPPETTQFDKITKEGKIKLEPGEIKTSVLNWSTSTSFDNLWAITSPIGTVATNRKPFGKFRLFAIEKMIHFSAASDSTIKTVYEINMDLSTKMSFHNSIQSTKIFVAYRDQNI
jgi:hypothetical protein